MKSTAKIEEITALTELLALNAMMESVRLGQNGAEFAANADELKTLAIDSQRLFFHSPEELAADAIEEVTEEQVKTMENLFTSLNDLSQDHLEVNEDAEDINDEQTSANHKRIKSGLDKRAR